ncbi:PAS domain S-box protein [Aggregicoccus sp. 17bor-14]|uniref:sensor histidine kinase n=1 Tax=Myxococcaceae TaxID=31 RepID=UPI00129CCEEC|nr:MULTISPECIES: PAS domain-containing sensor histidine kinase [Myxococcaceae]MBF5045308.1 PAS domain S-box protein [Simulacricoccus sp. 17bor-14]MRI91050.1 PAS domain S-box protein [Aggregicoccus sp. 17bor-14]
MPCPQPLQPEDLACALVEHSPDGLFTADAEGRLTDANPAGCLLLGAVRSELCGRPVAQLLVPEERARFEQLRTRARAGPEVRETGEWTLVRADGKRLPVELTACALRDGRWLGFVRDVSARRHTEEALRRRDERSRFLAEAGERLLASLDVDETLRTLAQLVQEHVAECCVVDLLEEDGSLRQAVVVHRDPARADILRTLQERWGLARAGHERLRAMEERRTLVLRPTREALQRLAQSEEHLRLLEALGVTKLALVPLVARGRALGALSVSSSESGFVFEPHDLQLLEALAARAGVAIDNARLYAESQAAIGARDAFLSIASHELNTPLTSLKLQVQSLERRLAELPPHTPGLEQVGVKFQVVGRQLRRLASLVSELLDLSRISAGRLRLEPEALDLAELVREVLARAGEDLARAGCTLRVALPEGLVGALDRLRVDQVVTNLVSNAMKYGAGTPLQVTLEACRLPGGGAAARLCVQDGGIGIAPEQQARLFRRFERLQSERHYSGFGLGLWIVKQVVDAMGGDIRVHSAPGEGARFEVLLPL